MSIVAFINQKGGVGKSLLSFNIGMYLSSIKKKKILFVDLDAQATLTDLTIPTIDVEYTLYDLLKRKGADPASAIISTDNFDIIPGDIQVAGLSSKIQKNSLLDILKSIKKKYDYIILDCPPSLGSMNIAALYAADTIISIVKPDIVSTRGLNLLSDTIRSEVSQKRKITAVIVNQYKKRKISELTVQLTKQDYPLLDTLVRDSSALSESASISQSIIEYGRNNNGYKDIEAVTEEMLSKGIL